MRRRKLLVKAALVLSVLVLLAGCAQSGNGSDQNRHNGFYGGISGGLTRP